MGFRRPRKHPKAQSVTRQSRANERATCLACIEKGIAPRHSFRIAKLPFPARPRASIFGESCSRVPPLLGQSVFPHAHVIVAPTIQAGCFRVRVPGHALRDLDTAATREIVRTPRGAEGMAGSAGTSVPGFTARLLDLNAFGASVEDIGVPAVRDLSRDGSARSTVASFRRDTGMHIRSPRSPCRRRSDLRSAL